MRNLKLEHFLNEPGDGPIKTITLRGIEDTVEFFNLVLELKLTKQEKADLVAFMRRL